MLMRTWQKRIFYRITLIPFGDYGCELPCSYLNRARHLGVVCLRKMCRKKNQMARLVDYPENTYAKQVLFKRQKKGSEVDMLILYTEFFTDVVAVSVNRAG